MGYWHSWYNNGAISPPRAEMYATAHALAVRIVKEQDAVPLCGYEAGSPPVATEDAIFFNGVEPDNGAGFELHGRYVHLPSRTACKTGRKPYDLVVTAVLATMRHKAPGCMKIATDGEPRDWEAGAAIASQILGEEIPVPWKAAES